MPPTNIIFGNANLLDWETLLKFDQNTFIVGNPEFKGAKKLSSQQKSELQGIDIKSKEVDYCTAWIFKSSRIVEKYNCQAGLVLTSSVVQGQQTSLIWDALFDKYSVEFSYAYRPFKWVNRSKNNPNVQIVIIGIHTVSKTILEKFIFNVAQTSGVVVSKKVDSITPYLTDGSALINHKLTVKKATQPLNKFPVQRIGSKPIDNGHYIFNATEKKQFLKKEPNSVKLFWKYWGAEELLSGIERFILRLDNATPKKLAKLPEVKKLIKNVEIFRSQSSDKGTRDLASTPTEFHVTTFPSADYLAVPEVSSEERKYLPCAILTPDIIPSNLLKISECKNKAHAGLIMSSMHLTWLRNIGGSLEGRLRYSTQNVHNNFPAPILSLKQENQLEKYVVNIFNTRNSFKKSSLRDLYDPITMPTTLIKSHQKLDYFVNKLYSGKPKISEEEQLTILLKMYESMMTP